MIDLNELRQEIAEEAFAVPKNRSSNAEFDPDARGDGQLEAEVAISIVDDLLKDKGFECQTEPLWIADGKSVYAREIDEGIREVVKVTWDYRDDVFSLKDGLEAVGTEPMYHRKYIEGPAFD